MRNTQPEGPGGIMEGLLLLWVFHVLAGVLIFFLGPLIAARLGYTFVAAWNVGFLGLCFWQLLYVVPLVRKLNRQGKTATMTGVIIGALLTALADGACYLTSTR
ncbi:MAG: hypothetical protein ACAF41_15390 [Leptolyngbya sp. BL-A-14]